MLRYAMHYRRQSSASLRYTTIRHVCRIACHDIGAGQMHAGHRRGSLGCSVHVLGLSRASRESRRMCSTSPAKSVSALSSRDLALVGVSTLLPSIAFGFMDNAIMILAGDQIDEALGLKFGLSTLAAAGLGNLISDVVGTASEGVIERNVKTPMPKITEDQRNQKPFQYALNFGRLVGIAIGCLLGMFPLLLRFPDEVQQHVDSFKRSIGLVPISDSLVQQLRNRTQRYCGDLRQASGMLGADDAALLVVDTRSKHRQLFTMHHTDKQLIAERDSNGHIIGVRPGHTIKAQKPLVDGDTGGAPASSTEVEPLERRPATRVLLGEVGFAHTLDFDDSGDLPVATTVQALSAQMREQEETGASDQVTAATGVQPPVVSSFAELNDLALRTAGDGHTRQMRLIIGGNDGGTYVPASANEGAARVQSALQDDPAPGWVHPVLVEAACSRLHGKEHPLQEEGVAILLRPVRDTQGRVLGVVALLESHPYTSSKHGSRHRRPKIAAKTRGSVEKTQRTAPWWELELAGDASAALEAQRFAVVSTQISMALDRLNRLKPTKSDIESRPVDLEAALQLVATN